MSQKSQALSVPGILMMAKVRDKMQTVAVRRCKRLMRFLLPLKEAGWSSEGKADRLQGEGRPAVSSNTTKDIAKHGSTILEQLRKPKDAPTPTVTIRGTTERENTAFREKGCGKWWCWDKQFLLDNLISSSKECGGRERNRLLPSPPRRCVAV